MLTTKLISKLISLAMMVGVLAWLPTAASAQCGTLLDGDGIEVANPVYYECNDGSASFDFWPLTEGTWTDVTVDWGDGTAPEFFNEWSEIQAIHHVYAYEEFATYVITFTTATCSASATLEKSVLVNPSIVVPEGWPTGACAPATLSFVNGSTNVTPDTEFTWTFDDGTTVTAGAEDEGATTDHLYAAFTTGCQREVTLSATNACRTAEFGVPAAVTIDYINIWDRDNPLIASTATTLCWPENTVDLRNVSEKVCLNNGNTEQRKERWDFGGPYGPGGISEINWRPWTNSNPIELTFPSTGVYTIWLAVENYCGVDSSAIEIVVREPLTADVTGPDVVCQGESMSLTATAPGADWYEWDFYGTDQYWYPSSSGSMVWTYNTPGTYEMVVNVGLDGQSESCSSEATHVIEVIAQPQAAIALSETEGCESLTISVEEIHGEGISYDWTWPENSSIVATPSGTMATLTAVGTHVFGVEVTNSNGCTRFANATAEIFALPEVAFTAGDVCEGTASTFTDLSLPSGSAELEEWSWSFGDGGTSDDQHPQHNYGETGAYTVNLEVSDGHCVNSTSQVVNVNESPTLSLSTSDEVGCSPLTVEFEATSNGDVVWEFGDGNGESGASVSHTYYGNASNDEVLHAVATALNEWGCTSQQTTDINLLPAAQASFSVSPAACSPYAPVFTNNSERAESFVWVFEDGSTSELAAPEVVLTNTSDTLRADWVQLIALNESGCHDPTSAVVTVFPEASFEVNLSQEEACSPFAFMAPVVPGTINHTWGFGDGSAQSNVPNPVHIYENTSSLPEAFTLTLNAQNAFGCEGTATQNVIVNPSPVADFTADIQSGCAPLTVTFEDASERGSSFFWNYGDLNTASGLNGTAHEHTFDLAGLNMATRAVTLTVEAEGGCSDTHTLAVELYPEVRAIPQGELEACAPWHADLVAAGFESATNHDISWTINGDEVVEGAHLQRTFLGLENNTETVMLELNVTSPYGCASDTTVMANVHHMPVASISLTESAACSGTEIGLLDGSMHANLVTLDWGEGDGASSEFEESHVFMNLGYEPVVREVVQTAITEAGCEAQSTFLHTVYPQVTAAFLPPADACAPFTMTIVNQSANANAGFEWNFGDGSPVSQSAQPNHLFNTPADASSTYSISLLATSTYGCVDSTSHDVTVHATPVAQLDVVRQEGCYPLEVTFANQSIGGDTYTWTYGTGLNSQESAAEHTVQYFNPSGEIVTYTAVLTVSTAAGCSSQDAAYIEVLPEIEARIEGGLAGCAPLEAEFLNLSDGAASYEWNFGDGAQSSTTHAGHTFFTSPGQDTTYTVSLVAESIYGCTDTTEVAVHVYAAPAAGFLTDATQYVFPESEVAFTNLSTAGESATYFWTFGDGQVSYEAEPGTHAYDSWGTFDITLNVDNGHCSSLASSAVQVMAPAPTIGFSGGGSGCAPLSIQFDNASMYAQSYRWEFSDGSVRSDDSPVHVFHEPGIYDVTLYVEGFEGTELVETHTAVVEVFPTAQAAFAPNLNEVMVPGQPVYFLNLSENATQYTWDFGDGHTSIIESPVHEYTTAGLYDVSLTANNEWGCATTYVLPEAILAEEGGMLVFPNAFTPNSTGPNGGHYDPYGYDNDVFRPMHGGVESYELMVFTKWGEMIFYSNDVQIGWDGYVHGKLAASDVYAWRAVAKTSDGETIQQVGNVTLIRR